MQRRSTNRQQQIPPSKLPVVNLRDLEKVQNIYLNFQGQRLTSGDI